jgi:copper resistance protein B
MRAIVLAAAMAATSAAAQQMDHAMHGMDMSGMDHAAPAAPADPAASAAAASDSAVDAQAPTPGDTPGSAAPPPVPTDYPADRYYPAARMAPARAAVMAEGQWRGSALMVDRLEYRAAAGQDGYAWKGSGWYGSDLDKLVIASEGEGALSGPVERAEVSLLWRHATGPFFNLEAGVRHDFQTGPQRTYAVIGVEGLAPYWIETEVQAFVSNKGDAHLRLAASHDLRLSGPLVLQPEGEVNVALQDVPALGIGAGFERIELGARLRYELRPELAPFVGVNWERSLGGTARALRASGDGVSAVTGVVGLHAFF